MATHGKARRDTIADLAHLRPFKRSRFGMWAMTGKGTGTGWMDPELKAQYLATEDIIYTVYSYRTPIAWVTEDGAVTIPPDGYSTTTRIHRGLAAAYLKGNR